MKQLSVSQRNAAVERTYDKPLTVLLFHQPTGDKASADTFELLSPRCPHDDRCLERSDGRLCHRCWFQMYVNEVGVNEALVENNRWKGQGQRAMQVLLEGRMRTHWNGDELCDNDDWFDARVVGIRDVVH